MDADEPGAELLIEGGEVVYRGRAVDYDSCIVEEIEGVLTATFEVDDPGRADSFQRENISGLALTAEGELQAWNTQFGCTFVR